MSLPRISKKARLSAAIAMTLFSASVSTVYALPTGGEVQSGTAEIKQNGSEMNINQGSDRVAIDWTSFNIANGETVNFNQLGADSIALNRVTGNDVSQIYGRLNANGQVFLINPNGVLFGKGASVDVGGLYASTANVNDTFMKEFGNNTDKFSLEIGKDNTAAIINQATITAINDKLKNEGGLVVLHAANVDNEGKITTGKGGKVQLAAGQKLNVNFDSAKINFTVDGGLSEANVLNAGTISAQNGVIAMTARGADKVLSSVVNTENAKLEAKGLTVNEKGEIVLDAGTGITAISGTVDASGENGADGGNITVNSDFIYVDNKAELNASGDNGGKVEMNTVKVTVEPNANIHAEATAGEGHSTGQWKVNVNGSVNSWWGNEGQMDAAKEKLAEAKKKVDEQFETAQAKYAEAEQAKKDRDAAQAEVERLTKEIAEKTKDNQTKQEALKTAETNLKNANEALEKAKDKQSEAQNKLTEAQNALNGANTAKTNAENANNDAAEALKNAQGAYEKAKQDVKDAQDALDRAKDELKTAKEIFDEKNNVYNDKVTKANDAKAVADYVKETYEKVNGLVLQMDTIAEEHPGWFTHVKREYRDQFDALYNQIVDSVQNPDPNSAYANVVSQEWFLEKFVKDVAQWFGVNQGREHEAATDIRNTLYKSITPTKDAYDEAQKAADDYKNDVLAGPQSEYNSKKELAETAASNLETAKSDESTKWTEAESAQKQANEAAGKLTDANKAVAEATKNLEAAKNVKNSADAAANDENAKQQEAQKAYDDAGSALTTSNSELEGLNSSKAKQEGIVTAKEKAYTDADAENKTNLKDAMDGLVAANKAYAQSAYNKAKQEAYGKIGSQAISNTLKNTDVEIVAHNDTNTADIGMYGSIMQDKGNATTLTLTADRNVMLRSTISAAKELNIVTKAGSPIKLEQGNRDGEKFGATLIYSDIATEGELSIKGNTYIGHYIRGNNAGEETGNDIHREAGKIAAKNVRFGGDVVLATGGTVDITADKKYGTVTFEGTVNSGNAYAFREITKKEQAQLQAEAAEQSEGVHPNYWEYARNEAKKANGHVAGESYLATITDSIEDSAASAVRPGNYSESYVGGKADEWVVNEDGTRSRDWKWVEGPEAGETFFTQIKNKSKKAVSGSAAEGYYSNFLAGEPSDSGELQDVLAIEYKGHWDDAFATGNKNGEGYAKSFIQEINVGESSLNINSANIELKGEVGNKRALNSIGLEGNTASIASPITTKGDMTINAALTGKNISLTSTEGSITLNNTVTAGTPKVEEAAVPQRRLMRLRSAVPTEGDVELNAAKDINSNDVTAQNKISFNAGNNVNLNGALKAGSNENGAVQISAGEAFINNVGANVIDTKGTWQVYSETPENDFFNGLYSENTAVWNADGTVDNDGKNTYSFKYQPTLTVTANDVTKTYGDVITGGDVSTGDGYKVTSNLADKNNKGEDLSKVFSDTTLAPKSFVEGVKLTSDGFASLASVAEYDIKATASGKNGYGLDFKSGKLTVNPKNVILSYGGFEIVNNRINVLEGTPSYDSQVVEGDTTAPKVAYGTTGLGDGLSYGVDYYVNGEKISSGDTVGNYRFNYDDSTVIRLDNPEDYKPQTNELMTSAVALKGNADVELSQKTAKVDGVDKVAGLMDGRLPLFKFAGSQVIPCGMFDISSTPDSVTMTASKISETDMSAAMEMPELEVNQYREYDRMLDTVDGAAAFKLTYNGASFDIYPNDNQAVALLEKGEETNNVNVGAAALSAAFGEMGLSLEEMQVICVHMDAKEILA